MLKKICLPTPFLINFNIQTKKSNNHFKNLFLHNSSSNGSHKFLHKKLSLEMFSEMPKPSQLAVITPASLLLLPCTHIGIQENTLPASSKTIKAKLWPNSPCLSTGGVAAHTNFPENM